MNWKTVVLAAAWLASPSLATAATPEPTRALTLERAIELALRHSPELAAAGHEKAAAEAALEQSGVRPNPELELGFENLGNARKREAGDRSTSLQIAQLIELGGKRAARVRVAASALEARGWELGAKRAEVVARVKQAFHDLLAAQQRQTLAAESVLLAEQVAGAVARRVLAGKVSPVEETRARLALAGAQVEREQARREHSALRARLEALLGQAASGFNRVEGNLERLAPLQELAALVARLRAAPELSRWTSELERRKAGIEAERAKAVPDVRISGGLTRFSVLEDSAFMVGISVPLPVFDRNRGGILEANRLLDRTFEERRAAEARLIAELSEVYHRTAAIASELETLRTAILPGSQNAFDATAKGYELGKFGLLDVLDAQRSLFQARTQHLRALADYQRGHAEIERLAGAMQ